MQVRSILIHDQRKRHAHQCHEGRDTRRPVDPKIVTHLRREQRGYGANEGAEDVDVLDLFADDVAVQQGDAIHTSLE